MPNSKGEGWAWKTWTPIPQNDEHRNQITKSNSQREDGKQTNNFNFEVEEIWEVDTETWKPNSKGEGQNDVKQCDYQKLGEHECPKAIKTTTKQECPTRNERTEKTSTLTTK